MVDDGISTAPRLKMLPSSLPAALSLTLLLEPADRQAEKGGTDPDDGIGGHRALAVRFASTIVPVTVLRKRYGFVRGTVIVLVWGGLRGGISIALALSLPETPFKGLCSRRPTRS
jgi:hypothetical protein